MLDDSQDSVWLLQRRAMNLCAGGFCIAAEQLGAVNPLLIMTLVPLFNVVIFPGLHAQPYSWLRPKPVRQMAVGMQLAALAFVGSAALQSHIDASPPNSVPFLWQVPQIILLTTAEVLVSATGLEFAYSQAPPSFKGSIVAVYYLSNACGDLIAAAVYSSLSAALSVQLLLLFAGLMAATVLVFIAVAAAYVAAPHTTTTGWELDGGPHAKLAVSESVERQTRLTPAPLTS
jgi:POT family proton-dependent oligopeptide transporter